MLNGYNTNTRRFTTDNPVLYNGQYYPSTTMPVDDGTGNIQDTTVFADRNGNYFNQSGTAVMLQQALPEVNVLARKRERGLTDGASDYIITPEEVDEINNRKAILRAAGYDVPKDNFWDTNQQALGDKLTTKQKDYDTTFTGLADGLWDKLTGNDTFFTAPMSQGEIKKYNPDEIDWSKTRKSQNKVVNAIQGTWGPIGIMAAIPTAIAAPVAAIATGIGGGLAGYTVNKASEAITGRDIGTNVAMHTPLTPEMGEMLNPGYTIGGLGATKRLQDAIYNQVTPYGYGDTSIPTAKDVIPKTKELALAVKDFFTPKRINTSINSTPAWKQRLDIDNITDPQLKETVLLRDDAWRLAMRQKPRTVDINGKPHSLYIKNPDGTYRYDLEYINKMREDAGLPHLSSVEIPIDKNLKQLKTGLNKALTGDVIAWNGGYADMELSLPKTWLDNNLTFNNEGNFIIKDLPFRIKDIWDIQPLKDSYRSFIPAVTNFANKHPNIFTNYIKNFEVVQGVGGKPFKLDMVVPSNTLSGIEPAPLITP